MTEVFVVRNQQGHYWGKAKLWVDGAEPRTVLRSKYRDEAVNTLVELSSKDVDLRGEIVAAPLNERGEPVLEVSQIPLPLTAEPDAAGGASPEDAENAVAIEPAAQGTE